MTDTIHQTLLNARTILAERGLSQGRFEDQFGHVCLRGAINIAIAGSSKALSPVTSPHESKQQFKQHMACLAALGFRSDRRLASEWNDDPNRTLEGVLARFDKAIQRIEREEAESLVAVS